MSELVLIGILLVGGIAIYAAKNKSVDGMQDTPVSITNVRKGVERGWYKATLKRVNGQPAIYLYGNDVDGNEYGDTYPISEADWQALKAEGFTESCKDCFIY